MQKDLVDFLLDELRQRPGMYLGAYALSPLPTFVAGFMIAANFYDTSRSAMDRFGQFQDWFWKKYSIDFCSFWHLPFLEMAGNDEKAALELLFTELENFVTEGTTTVNRQTGEISG